MIVSKNENTYLKYVARCLAHKCATTVIIGNHISCNFRPLPVLLPGGNGQGKGNVRYIFLWPHFLTKYLTFPLFFTLQTRWLWLLPSQALWRSPPLVLLPNWSQLPICPRFEWGTHYLGKRYLSGDLLLNVVVRIYLHDCYFPIDYKRNLKFWPTKRSQHEGIV